jgi:hypothetical protein
MAEWRFGVVSESVREGRAWLDFARQVEDSGIDVMLLRDHFSAAFDAKVGVLRAAAGDRFSDLAISAFGTFIVTGRRRAGTEDLISPGTAGAGSKRRRSGKCRRCSSAARIRSVRTSRRGTNDSACRTLSPARTAGPRWPRSSVACRPRHRVEMEEAR